MVRCRRSERCTCCEKARPASDEAGEAGVIHRDIKPSNIGATRRGGRDDVAKLLDFGLVQPASTNLSADPSREGQIVGTPLYISPEQAWAMWIPDGAAISIRLGWPPISSLTGRPPFDEGSAIAALIAHARDQASPPSRFREGLPADLERIALALPCLRPRPSCILMPRVSSWHLPNARAQENGTNIRPIVGGERADRFWRKSAHKKTFVTRTPKSVSIKISSPRATSRPLDVSSTGARLWRLSSTTSPGFRSANWVSVKLTRPSSTVSVTGRWWGPAAGGVPGEALG